MTTKTAICSQGDTLPKLLIVEEEVSLLECYSEVLGGRYIILATSSGREALRRIQHHQDIDLAIVDFRLHDMPGTEVLEEIKSIKPSIPVILTVANGNEDTAVKAFRCGARDYIKKPFNLSELANKLDFFLSLRQKGETNRKVEVLKEEKVPCPAGHAADNFYRIHRVIQYLNENYMLDCALRKAANLACMSRRHFSRTFKNITGVSYQDYVNDLRIKKAGEMLNNTLDTVTTISYAVGYNDLTCFGRMFKKITGKTPSDYRISID